MFGMGFMEIFLVLVIAVIALGPEKLPTAMVDIAKFFRKFKSGIEDAKSTLDNELNISEMKQEAEKFKQSVAEVKNIASVDMPNLTSLDMDDEDEVEEKPKKKKEKQSKQALYAETTPKSSVKTEKISLTDEKEA